jgi:hypothetical protein
MAGSAIFTVGLLTLCVQFASALSRERILLWFGLFAAPYGLALILRSILLPEWDARVDLVVVIVGRLIGLASSIPALLLFREFYGKGWRLSEQRAAWEPQVDLTKVKGVSHIRCCIPKCKPKRLVVTELHVAKDSEGSHQESGASGRDGSKLAPKNSLGTPE